MKSNYRTFSLSQLDKEIGKAAYKELEAYKDEVYDKISLDIFQQAVAVCLTALELQGWRGKRLRQFKDWVDEACNLMFHGVMDREYTTRMALARMKEVYGIDLKESKYEYKV